MSARRSRRGDRSIAGPAPSRRRGRRPRPGPRRGLALASCQHRWRLQTRGGREHGSVRLPDRRRRHDGGRRGARDPGAGRQGLDRDHRGGSASAVQSSAADEGSVEGGCAGQHLAQDRGGRRSICTSAAGCGRSTRRAGGSPTIAATTYEYRRLLLATGGEPRRLPGAPEGVIYLRTLDDYRATRQLADRGAGFVVLGGGFIGAEIAAALRMQGRDVTMIVPGQGLGGARLSGRALPLPGGVLPRAWRADAGGRVGRAGGATGWAVRRARAAQRGDRGRRA